MPRYFFNVRSSGTFVQDEEGTELDTLQAAKDEAEIAARGLVIDAIRSGAPVGGNVFEVTDESGALAFSYPCRNAIRLK